METKLAKMIAKERGISIQDATDLARYVVTEYPQVTDIREALKIARVCWG